MATLKDFHKSILPDVQGCPISILNNALLSTLIDFCTRAQIWKVESAATSIVAGEPRYQFAPAEGQRVVSVDFVTLADQPLLPIAEQELDNFMSTWRTLEVDTPTAYYMETPDMLRLIGIPKSDMEDALKVYAYVAPSRIATTVPDWLLEVWGDVIAHGTLTKLHSMTNKTWADHSVVNYHERKYRTGVAKARSKNLKSNLTLGREIIPRPF